MSLNARQNLKFAGIKLIELIATLFVVSFLTFAAFSIIPGDTAQIMLGPNATPEQVARLRTELGLDQPLPVRYITWVAGAFTGNLGNSSSFKVPVISLIAQRLPDASEIRYVRSSDIYSLPSLRSYFLFF